MKWLATVLVLGGALLTGVPCAAQETSTATRAQRKLIAQGLDAHAAGKFDEAATHFRASNDQGELNIVWLNLGRALQKAGDCDGARAAFQRALTAPAVPKPPRALVAETAEKYSAELLAACPGTLRVDCAQPDIKLDVDGRELACGESISLPPGTYRVNARRGGESQSESVEVAAFETAGASIAFASPVSVEPDPRTDDAGSNLGLYAWVATGVSASLFATGAVVAVQRSDTIHQANTTPDESEYRSLRDDYDSQSTLMWTAFGLGLAAGTAAGFLFFLDANDEPSAVGWHFGPTSVGVEVRF